MLDMKIDTREAFSNLYFEKFYLVSPNLFIGPNGMLLHDDIFRDHEVFGRKVLTSSELPSIDQLLVYFHKQCEIYELFWNKMFYLDEEPKQRNIGTHPKFYQVGPISHPCEENWKTYKDSHEKIPYFYVESTFEGKDDMVDECSPRGELDGEDLHIDDNFYNIPLLHVVKYLFCQGGSVILHVMKQSILEISNLFEIIYNIWMKKILYKIKF